MNRLKPMMYAAVAVILLGSCKTAIHTIPVPNGANTFLNIPAKKGVLIESEAHTWHISF
jgi:hypothetical protein